MIADKRTPLFGKVLSIGPKVIRADGSPLESADISWNYEEDGEGNNVLHPCYMAACGELLRLVLMPGQVQQFLTFSKADIVAARRNSI